MNFKLYLSNLKYVILHSVCIVLIVNLVSITSVDISNTLYDIIYLNVLILSISIVFIVFGYRSFKQNYGKFYKELNNGGDIDLYVPPGNTFFEKIIKDILKVKNNEIYRSETKLKKHINDLDDYITKWVHEIKIPIAVCELITDKIDDEVEVSNNISQDLRGEFGRIKFLIEQILYAYRLSSYYDNIVISEVNLNKVIREVCRKNSFFFISQKIDLKLYDIDVNVKTDKKWISYVINQIINNACKYVENNGTVKIYSTEDEKSVKLNIEDNGQGIMTKDLERVFDKGFTGNNGFKFKKSTGMGLYFSKKICDKLSHDIKVTSEFKKYTKFTIVFYKLSDYFKVQ